MKLKPGQLCTIRRVVYRAKKQDPMAQDRCQGCALNDFFKCPNIQFANTNKTESFNCDEEYIILVKV